LRLHLTASLKWREVHKPSWLQPRYHPQCTNEACTRRDIIKSNATHAWASMVNVILKHMLVMRSKCLRDLASIVEENQAVHIASCHAKSVRHIPQEHKHRHWPLQA
jgi:hypothetical protein